MEASPIRTTPVPFGMGYRMPAEWQPHDSTWLTWPKDPITFPGDAVKQAELTYLQMIEALSQGERVDLLVDDQKTQNAVSRRFESGKDNVVFHQIRTVDVWMRDYGPIFIKGADLAATKWKFNAWGDKYEELKHDDEVGRQVVAYTGLRTFEPGIVLEGGSIDVNGLGSCITTEQCLLNKNRNPQLRKPTHVDAWQGRDYLGRF